MPKGIIIIKKEKNPMKKILALILALAMLFSFAACGNDGTNENTEPTDVVDVSDEATDENVDTDAPVVDGEDNAPAVDGETASGEAAESTESTAPAITAAPVTTEEIITLYNNTINRAYDSRVGFNKVRYIDNENLNAGFLLNMFGDLIYTFMGIGAENKYTMDVTKGKWESDVPHHYLRKSTLSAADVTAAKCTEANGKYTIVLNVKPGNSKGAKTGSFNNSPIDKCGICVGDADKSYFDHKTGPVIYSAIGEYLSGVVIEENYKNAVVKAEIDAATGNLLSLTVEYDVSIVIDAAGGGNATGKAHIFYKNFKY